MTCLFNKCKYGKVDEGYQYCKNCGKARSIECNHKWETIRVLQRGNIIYSNAVNAHVYILRCSNCGEVKQKTIS